MKKYFSLAILVLLLALAAGAAYFFFPDIFSANLPGAQPAGTAPIVAAHSKYPPREVPAGYKEFRSDLYDFSILYPDDLTAAARDEGGGAATITFENDQTVSGFQIFIVPFSGSQITDAQFKKDIPSGVRNNLKDIKIDGATGASFYSTDAILGDTAEVWFIRGGYLYEVNTFKELDTWLSDVMTSWKFL